MFEVEALATLLVGFLGLVGAFSAVFVNHALTERTLTRERRNHRINLGTGLLIERRMILAQIDDADEKLREMEADGR